MPNAHDDDDDDDDDDVVVVVDDVEAERTRWSRKPLTHGKQNPGGKIRATDFGTRKTTHPRGEKIRATDLELGKTTHRGGRGRGGERYVGLFGRFGLFRTISKVKTYF